MTKRLVLFLAALAVATLGRETSAVSTLSDQPTKLNILAFGFPTHPSANYAFGLPTHPSAKYAFGLPTHPGTAYVFGLPTHSTSGYVQAGKSSLDIAMLPLGAETGRHIRPKNSELEESVKDLELSKSIISNPLAMLPLGRESGRHIRTDSARDTDSEAGNNQDANPVTELSEHFGSSYAMLPLGAEMGRHIRNLKENNKEPEKTVAASVPKATA